MPSSPNTRVTGPFGGYPQLQGSGYTLYVNPTTGSNNNPGTSASPVQTIAYALQLLGKQTFWEAPPTINLADGDYSAQSAGALLIGQIVAPSIDDGGYANVALYIVGNTATPANVVLPYIGSVGCNVAISGCDMSLGADAYARGALTLADNKLNALGCYGGRIDINAGNTFAGAATAAITATGGAVTVASIVTVTGTPAYATGFAFANYGSVINFAAQPTGSATGPRYRAESNGIIDTGGGGANYLPGNAGGSTGTQGQYL